jgi:hypothetical protein
MKAIPGFTYNDMVSMYGPEKDTAEFCEFTCYLSDDTGSLLLVNWNDTKTYLIPLAKPYNQLSPEEMRQLAVKRGVEVSNLNATDCFYSGYNLVITEDNWFSYIVVKSITGVLYTATLL